ncbi:MAG TPA: carbamoyltransferase HypF [Thermoanaerobaculia bacterium]|nr:carbamoyltransferase HypF [Thermoanaerobaculia bacterium]
MSKVGRHIEIRGIVQGVGFRPWVYQLATNAGVAGRVGNDSRGVVIDAFGNDADLDIFTERLGHDAPPAARIHDLEWRPIAYETVSGFTIVASEQASERNVSIPPDLATCDDCLADISDPSNRRHLYPFTNCTNCGPRYTIVRGVPYDREQTTMAPFAMCDHCRREYENPLDRRFHAQPNACPACGPRLFAAMPTGRTVETDHPLAFAARALKAQLIVAVKGLGGFHLACDATSPLAVQRLRDRKRREAKPLAVMVRDLEEAERFAALTNEERTLLTSIERPIVLVARRAKSALAREIAADTPLIGLFLPYTPLHHLLLREAGIPLVMTSGNTSDEPMAITNEDALERLNDIADVFLMHDREIETRADDSVTRIIANAPVILRRARGFVPRGIALETAFDEPILAVGAHLKNAICIGTNRTAFLGPHVGDLDTLETVHSFEKSIDQLKMFVGVEPRIVAHDLHPEYESTRWARRGGLASFAVQHHHAHVVSAMAEHGLTGNVLGIAYDGTGYGTDGTSWGGEFLVAGFASFTRAATFRAIPLAGADQAIRQVWRIALAVLDEAFEGEPPLQALRLFETLDRSAVASVRRMIATKCNVPRARGVGRWFDAFGALGLAMTESRYEGEVATRWNAIADANERGCYEMVLRDGPTPWEIDPRPMVKAATLDLIRGVAPAIVSARFHNTIAAITIEVARAVNKDHLPIVLSGGCFANALLTERILDALPSAVLNRTIPPGDGGLALGQAVIANALSQASRPPATIDQQLEPTCA